MGGKSELPTMHKAPHRIYFIFFTPLTREVRCPEQQVRLTRGADVVLESFMKPYHLKEGEVITRFIYIKPNTGHSLYEIKLK